MEVFKKNVRGKIGKCRHLKAFSQKCIFCLYPLKPRPGSILTSSTIFDWLAALPHKCREAT